MTDDPLMRTARTCRRRVTSTALAAVCALGGATGVLSAAEFRPTTPAALLDALSTANRNRAADTIDLGGRTFRFSTADNNIAGSNALPSVLADGGRSLTLRNGIIERRVGAGVASFRLFHIAAGADLQLSQVTLRNGDVSALSDYEAGYGGAIYNAAGAALTLTQSTISASRADDGGALYNAGSLRLIDSTVADNRALNNGGALYNLGDAELINSTVSGNFANDGGAIYHAHAGGDLALLNSTIAGNSAIRGGGLYLFSETSYGTARVAGGAVALANSVLADNAGGDCQLSAGGAVPTVSASLIAAGGCAVSSAGANLINISARLGPLTDNGGPTLTRAPLPGSPLIDAARAVSAVSDGQPLVNDQRGTGYPRRVGSGVDIGALEVAAKEQPLFQDQFED